MKQDLSASCAEITYRLQLISDTSRPKDLPAFRALSRKEAFSVLFKQIDAELEKEDGSIVVVLLFEKNHPIAEIRIRGN